MKLSFKSLVFIGVLLTVVASGLIYVRFSQEELIKDTFEDRSVQRKEVFNKIFEFSEKQIETLSKDYTYWDEMVEFVLTKDLSFAQDNIDTSLSTYGASSVWVYNLQEELVYSVSDVDGQLKKGVEFPLNISQKSEIFAEKRLVHFFVNSDLGIIDVFGATIHPSEDSERKTEPKGYFFVAKVFDQDLTTELGKATDTKVSVLTGSMGVKKTDEIKLRTGNLAFYKTLLGYDVKPVGYLKVDSQFESVEKFASNSDRDFLIFFALALGFLSNVFLVIYLQDRSVEHAMKIAEVMTANLTESEARFRAMNDASPFGIFVTDPKGKCIYTNAAYQKLSGQSQEESWGEGWLQPLHPHDRQRVYAQWYQAANAGGDFSSEHRITLKDNQEISLRVKADGIRVEDKLLGFIGVAEDITESKHHAEEIEKRNKELERLNKSMVNRELKMVELKAELEKLKGGKK